MQVQTSANVAAGVAVLQKVTRGSSGSQRGPGGGGVLSLVREAIAAASASDGGIGRLVDVRA